MKKLVVISTFILLALSNCSSEPSEPSEPKGPRTGAICNDGWESTATGQGACSHHGGVDYWLYEDN